MLLTNGCNIEDEAVLKNLKRLTNQIYKLLPNREENIDWCKPLETIIEELQGMDRLFIDQHDLFFMLLCKLEGLFYKQDEEKFPIFRRTIFECLALMNNLKNSICQD